MEELTSEKLKDALLKDDTHSEIYLKCIANNVNISEELKSLMNMFVSDDYLLQDLNREDINQIMKFYKATESKIIQSVGNNKETLLELEILRLNFMLNLNRAFNPKKSNGDFFSILNLSLRRK